MGVPRYIYIVVAVAMHEVRIVFSITTKIDNLRLPEGIKLCYKVYLMENKIPNCP
jgi:hypothetical protein